MAPDRVAPARAAQRQITLHAYGDSFRAAAARAEELTSLPGFEAGNEMDGVGWRECVDCSETKISPDEPAWKVRCTACWQNNIKRKT